MFLSVCEFSPNGNSALCVLQCGNSWELNLYRTDMYFENGPLVELLESTAYLYYE